VDPAGLHHRHPVTPYAGRSLSGVVHTTWLRGEPVDVNGAPTGRLLTRGEK
jgi:allantoinase